MTEQNVHHSAHINCNSVTDTDCTSADGTTKDFYKFLYLPVQIANFKISALIDTAVQSMSYHLSFSIPFQIL